MNCQRCNSDRVLNLNARHKDMYTERFKGIELSGYAMTFPWDSSGDHTELDVCLECGQTQGDFPLEHYTETKEYAEDVAG